MAYQLWAILKAANWTVSTQTKKLEQAALFQELYSTCGMGMFINITAHKHDAMKRLLDVLDAAIKAHLLVVPKSLIYNEYWGDIAQNAILGAYFEQFPSWRRFFTARVARPGWMDYVAVVPSLIELLFSYVKMQKGVQEILGIVAHPWTFSALVAAEYNISSAMPDNKTVLMVNRINQQLSEAQESAEPMFLPHSLVHLIEPYIDIDWTVITTGIMMLYNYSIVLTKNPEILDGFRRSDPYISGQRYRMLVDGKTIAWEELADSGLIDVEPDIEINYAEEATPERIEELKEMFGPENIITIQLSADGVESPYIAGTALPIGDDEEITLSITPELYFKPGETKIYQTQFTNTTSWDIQDAKIYFEADPLLFDVVYHTNGPTKYHCNNKWAVQSLYFYENGGYVTTLEAGTTKRVVLGFIVKADAPAGKYFCKIKLQPFLTKGEW